MLMVSTTVRMLYRIHSHTANLGPRVALYPVLVVGSARLEHWLFRAASPGHLAHRCAAVAANDFLATRWELDASDSSIGVVRHDDGVVSRASSEGAPIPRAFLDVANDGPFGHFADGLDVADVQASVLAAVEVLPGIHAFRSNEKLLILLVANGVAEFNLGKRGAASRIVQNFCHDATDVAMAFGGVQNTELRSAFPMCVVRLENGPPALALTTDDATHLHIKQR